MSQAVFDHVRRHMAAPRIDPEMCSPSLRSGCALGVCISLDEYRPELELMSADGSIIRGVIQRSLGLDHEPNGEFLADLQTAHDMAAYHHDFEDRLVQVARKWRLSID